MVVVNCFVQKPSSILIFRYCKLLLPKQSLHFSEAPLCHGFVYCLNLLLEIEIVGLDWFVVSPTDKMCTTYNVARNRFKKLSDFVVRRIFCQQLLSVTFQHDQLEVVEVRGPDPVSDIRCCDRCNSHHHDECQLSGQLIGYQKVHF